MPQKKPAKDRTPLLLKIMSRLGEVNLQEAWIPPIKGTVLAGLWEKFSDGSVTVTINPVPDIVDSVIHEMLHEMYPDYSEKAVKSLTTKLMRQLTTEQMLTIYNEYKRKVG